MSLITKFLVVLVAIEFFYIMYVETFATTSKTTSRIFNIPQKELESQYLQVLFKNQGIYNGLIGLGILYAAFVSHASKELSIFLLLYIILVAAYGSITSDKKIILKQGGIAIIALITLLF